MAPRRRRRPGTRPSRAAERLGGGRGGSGDVLAREATIDRILHGDVHGVSGDERHVGKVLGRGAAGGIIGDVKQLGADAVQGGDQVVAQARAGLPLGHPLEVIQQAVQDLADLFRANLSEKRNTITLEEELEVARIYQRIEQLRLGDRLRVDWNIADLPKQALVPGLLLQPLLENAIYHGIEPRPDGGVVTVNGELVSGLITVVVRNPVAPRRSDREGNRLALANIRERLALMYGDRALVKAGQFDDEYIVTLRFPHVEEKERLSA